MLSNKVVTELIIAMDKNNSFIYRENGISIFNNKSLVEEIKNPNTEDVENTIIGETFIKPKTTYQYNFFTYFLFR